MAFVQFSCCGLSTENAISDDKDYRVEVLAAAQHLDRLDKDKLSDEEKEEAARIREERGEEFFQVTEVYCQLATLRSVYIQTPLHVLVFSSTTAL